MSVRAVIWDFGGVFTTSPFERFSAYETARNIPVGTIRKVNSTNPDDNAWAKFERSDVDIDAFDKLFLEESTALGHPIPGKEVIELLGGEVRPEMVKALDTIIGKGLTCACITNNVRAGIGPSITYDPVQAKKVEAVMARFQIVIESSRVNLRKPDPRIYQLACEQIAVRPSEAVYLDDLGINLKPAKAMGMKTIKVGAPGPALDELERVLGFGLR